MANLASTEFSTNKIEDLNAKRNPVNGVYVTVAFGAVADAETEIAHTLGKVPIGYQVVGIDKAAHVYTEGTTPWTDENIYLASDVATVAATILVF